MKPFPEGIKIFSEGIKGDQEETFTKSFPEGIKIFSEGKKGTKKRH